MNVGHLNLQLGQKEEIIICMLHHKMNKSYGYIHLVGYYLGIRYNCITLN
jgi:hypothetical protein